MRYSDQDTDQSCSATKIPDATFRLTSALQCASTDVFESQLPPTIVLMTGIFTSRKENVMLLPTSSQLRRRILSETLPEPTLASGLGLQQP